MIGLGPAELGIILVIVLVIFGGKKLRNLGSDLGGAISEFKTSLNDDSDESTESDSPVAPVATPAAVAPTEPEEAASSNETAETK